LCFGGDKESRTPDLFIANEALYQLSYIPKSGQEMKKIPEPMTRPEPPGMSSFGASTRGVRQFEAG
jgi:hypothetical protein